MSFLLLQQVLSLLLQMPPVVELDELDDLHGHVWLVHQAPGERQAPEVPALRVTTGQVDVRYVADQELGTAPGIASISR